MSYGNGLMHVAQRGPLLPPPHRRDGQFFLLLPPRHGERRSAPSQAPPSAPSPNIARGLLTLFAVDALTDALAGGHSQAAAARHPPCRVPDPMSAIMPGRGRCSRFEAGAPLAIVAGGAIGAARSHGAASSSARFIPLSGASRLMFERTGQVITGASWGPSSFVRAGSAARIAPSDPALARLAGRYVNDRPVVGTIEHRRARRQIVDRHRNAADPDRRQFVARRAGKLVARARLLRQSDRRPPADVHFSGEKFIRHDI